jgi:hypothetical protein
MPSPALQVRCCCCTGSADVERVVGPDQAACRGVHSAPLHMHAAALQFSPGCLVAQKLQALYAAPHHHLLAYCSENLRITSRLCDSVATCSAKVHSSSVRGLRIKSDLGLLRRPTAATCMYG